MLKEKYVNAQKSFHFYTLAVVKCKQMYKDSRSHSAAKHTVIH